MTITELQSRVNNLEARLAELEGQWEKESVRASVRRAKAEIDNGGGVPARDLINAIRAKRKLTAK